MHAMHLVFGGSTSAATSNQLSIICEYFNSFGIFPYFFALYFHQIEITLVRFFFSFLVLMILSWICSVFESQKKRSIQQLRANVAASNFRFLCYSNVLNIISIINQRLHCIRELACKIINFITTRSGFVATMIFNLQHTQK